MVLDKHNLKRTDRQQLRNPSVRGAMKQMEDRRGLAVQSRLRPSTIVRQQGLAMGGAKRRMKQLKEDVEEIEGGKMYHSAEYKMRPVGGAKRKMKGESEMEAEGGRKKRGRKKKQEMEVEMEEEMEEKPKRRGRGKLEITHYEGGAKMLGKDLGEFLLKEPKIAEMLKGRGLFDKFLEGLKEAGKGFVYPIKAISQVGKVLPLPAPLKAIAGVGGLLEGVDDPQWVKALKGKGGKRGSGFFSDLLQTDRQRIQKIGGPRLKRPILKNKGGKLGSPLQVEHPNIRGGKKSDWIDFVKKVAKDKGIPYRDALKVASKMRKK
jgi:hypothetical protein